MNVKSAVLTVAVLNLAIGADVIAAARTNPLNDFPHAQE
jgi:hypothetical protein